VSRLPRVHLWEKVELTLKARRSYRNPYTEVDVWVDLTGPGFQKRCFGFWDGGNTFRVRVTATAPGEWRWTSGASVADPGLAPREGAFEAVPWSEEEKLRNPCRRGFLRPSSGGHAFQHADGTPFLLLGDTWWPTGTFRYFWHEDDRQRPIGPGMGFKDAVRFRKAQGFNCIGIIAAFPNWANDGLPARLETEDGTLLRAAWGQAGTSSAKDMHDEAGNRPFLFPGPVRGYENVFPDLDNINPAYFRSLDRKVDYLNSQGFFAFIEPARRDIGPAWKRFFDWPGSYIRYMRYIWNRYQANHCLLSPIHFDSANDTIPADEWNEAANAAIDTYGPPPFGTPVGPNPDGSSLLNFGHTDRARWLTFHQVGNRREHTFYELLTDIFRAVPPVPALHGEPFYDGLPWNDGPPGGSPESTRNCRSGMYGSVLSGGLGGYIHGVHGLWSGEVEELSQYSIWESIQWPAASQLRHLRSFIMSVGARYQDLMPEPSLLCPCRSGPEMGYTGWAYCARGQERDLFLLYFEQDCPRAVLSGTRPGGNYLAEWFDPRTGAWHRATRQLADADGRIALPPFPGGVDRATEDWALKIALA